VLATSAVGAVAFVGCTPPKHELAVQSRVRLAEDLVSAYENWYATACRGCDAGCGVVVRVVEGRAKKVEGNPGHPVNRGKLCARGQAAVQEPYHPDRLRGPGLRTGDRGMGDFLPISWEDGLGRLVGRLRALQQQGRGGEVVVLTRPLGGHQALVMERFAGALGASWLRLDALPQAAVQEAFRRVLGADRLPELDVARAQYVLSFGADFLGTWLSPVHYGVGYGVFRQGYYDAEEFAPRREGGRPRGYLVQVEPRFSTTAASADEWAPIAPGREGLLALSLAQVILAEGLADPSGAAAFGDPRGLDAYQPERVAQETGIAAERIRRIARDFATRRPSLAFAGGPAAAQTNGTANVAAVLALNLLVGSVGSEGGLLPNPEPFLGLRPTTAPSDLSAWQDLADRLRGGLVQAVLVYDVNPVHGLPAALGFGEALARAPFVAGFSSFPDETTALADLVLPSHTPLEEWGSSVPSPGPGVRTLTVQQPVVRPLHDTRSFWDVLLTVAGQLGGPLAEALPWPSFKEVLRDGARQLAQEARAGQGQPAEQERFWVELLQRGGWWEDRGREAGDGEWGRNQPPSPSWVPPRFAGAEEEFPFHLVVFPHNTLGDGRAAHLPWLQAAPDPVTTAVWQTWVELNPRLAAELGLREGDIVAVETPRGRVEASVYVSPAAPPTVLGMPMGWGHTAYGRWAEGRGINPMTVLAPLADEATGALAYAATRARLVKTGRHTRLPKLEGTVPAYQLPDDEVLKVTNETS
jgi:anaerobic selenocysteine-containing dehydrogenase